MGYGHSGSEDAVPLGATGIRVPPMGIGTWQWGDRVWWQYGDRYGEDDLRRAFEVSIEHGVRLFDTAEIYGMGTSERLLGEFQQRERAAVIATKFFPFPWRFRVDDLIRALRGSLRRMGASQVDLYQIHWPVPPVPLERWMDGLVRAVDLGLAKAVGVSNFNQRQTIRAVQALGKYRVPLASNQVSYSLLNRSPERDGVLETCQALGVSVIAYSPLGMGMLTGKYSVKRPPPGVRRRRYPDSRLRALEPLLASLREISERRSKTPSQVALNWIIYKGAIPIPGAKTATQAEENIGALGWRLTPDEVAELDETSARVS